MSSQLDVALFFDVEDYFHPPESGSDDIIRLLAEMLDAEALRANFLFIAARARLLKERGRRDIINSLARHAIGVHTLTGEHPCLPEYTAGKDWDTAVAVTREYEARAWEIIRDVFGRAPTCLSQHAQYGAPYVFPVANEFGVPYVYGYPAAPPRFGLSWYANALNVPYVSPLSGLDALPYFEIGDESYSDSAYFDAALARLQQRISACLTSNQPYLTIFVAHPYHLRYMEFNDYWQYVNGVNIPRELWGVKNGGPRRRTNAQMEVAWRNLRRLFQFIRRHEALNILTLPELQARYGRQPSHIPRSELLAAAQVATAIPSAGMVTPDWYARRGARAPHVAAYGDYSAGELMVGWALSLGEYLRSGALPDQLERQAQLGPRDNPFLTPEVWQVTRRGFGNLVSAFCAWLERDSHLPHNLGEPGERVGLGTLYRAFAEAFLAVADTGELPETIPLLFYPRFPEIARELGYAYLDIADDEHIPPDLNHYNIIKDAKLQTWTLKPARAASGQPAAGVLKNSLLLLE